ncbi:serine hydrolase domain-containing protein [Brevundimonas lenta]|uniref:CubicO group peptidase (Beta-lactamase class C family) n=1 Tax=Brevundimonas lenta TaxID=424796 RepID=A0A7W6NQD2_9CAUL|nr:serine hydrolase domain-containing protein [Brevundimonas lenta]MBB4083464.1 CubicO group peptidase (beta-lactamase class C family) [Brevundimonas lenta]
MLNRRDALGLTAAAAALPATALARPADPWTSVRDAAALAVRDQMTPGMQLSAWSGSTPLFSEAFGSADLEAGAAMAPASVVRIGSATKTFTAATVLKLQAEGLLSIQDPLARFLPDFPRAADITLERLLNHTAGLSNYTDEGTLEDMFRTLATPRSTTQMVDFLAAQPKLQRVEPGAEWHYSNTGYILLGAVIEKATGQSLQDAMASRLFSPLGLTASAVDDETEVVRGRAAAYTNLPGASGFAHAAFVSMSAIGGSGAMRSSADDLCRWFTLLLGGQALPPDALRQALTPATLAGGDPTLDLGDPVQYGLGLFLPLPGQPRIVTHTGTIMGFMTYVGADLDTGITTAVVFNTDSGFHGPNGVRTRMRNIREALRTAAVAATA